MPYYKFENTETGEIWTQLMGISEADDFLNKNPNIQKLYNLDGNAPVLHSGRGLRKVADGFKDVLKEIKKNHSYGGRIETNINTM